MDGVPGGRSRLPVSEGSALAVAGPAATLLGHRVVGHLATAAVATATATAVAPAAVASSIGPAAIASAPGVDEVDR